MNEVVELKPWRVYEFPWGTAIRHQKGHWTNVYLKPTGQEIDVSNLNVILHDNGIEFLGKIGIIQ